MTPEERELVIELFDRLATLEDAQRDAEAERLIRDGLRQAPNALYALVQTVLVQDEALKRADARIRELEGSPEPATRDIELSRRRARQPVRTQRKPRLRALGATGRGGSRHVRGLAERKTSHARSAGSRPKLRCRSSRINGRLVSRHRRGSRGRRDRRLAAARRHSQRDGRCNTGGAWRLRFRLGWRPALRGAAEARAVNFPAKPGWTISDGRPPPRSRDSSGESGHGLFGDRGSRRTHDRRRCGRLRDDDFEDDSDSDFDGDLGDEE